MNMQLSPCQNIYYTGAFVRYFAGFPFYALTGKTARA